MKTKDAPATKQLDWCESGSSRYDYLLSFEIKSDEFLEEVDLLINGHEVAFFSAWVDISNTPSGPQLMAAAIKSFSSGPECDDGTEVAFAIDPYERKGDETGCPIKALFWQSLVAWVDKHGDCLFD